MRLPFHRTLGHAEPRRRWAAGVAIGALLLGGAVAASLIFTGAGQAQQTMMGTEKADALFATAAPLAEPPSSPLPPVGPSSGFTLISGSSDFNRDGNLDLLSTATNQLDILRGNGQGGFSGTGPRFFEPEVVQRDPSGVVLRPKKGVQISPLATEIADVDGNGRPDVAALTQVADLEKETSERRLYYFLNFEQTGPTREPFPATVPKPANDSGAVELVSADFDQDGSIDLLLLHRLLASPEALQTLPPPFTRAYAFERVESLRIEPELPSGIAQAAARDFNGDGIPDLAAQLRNDQIALLLGNGTLDPDSTAFTLEITASFDDDEDLRDLAFGDFNNDGRPDLVALVNNEVRTFLNRGGRFEPTTAVSPSVRVTQLKTGDFNGDGNADLFLDPVDGFLELVLLSDGTGRFDVRNGQAYAEDLPSQRALVADLTNDGSDDLIVERSGEKKVLLSQETPLGLSRFRINGSSLLTPADLDGDGDPDMVIQSNDGLGALWNNGRGAFARQPLIELNASTVIRGRAADLDDDGSDEILMLRRLGAPTGGAPFNQLILVEANGRDQEAVVQDRERFQANGVPNLAVGDLDGDGREDVLTSDTDRFIVWLNRGDGQFSQQTFSIDEGQLSVAEVADFDGNGRAEILAGLVNEDEERTDFVRFTLADNGLQRSSPVASVEASPLIMTQAEVNGEGSPEAAALSIETEAPSGGNQGEQAAVTGAVLTLFQLDDQGDLQATTSPVPDWTRNETPVPFAGLALNDLNGDGLPDAAFTLVRGAPIQALLGKSRPGQFGSTRTEIPCRGGPLFARDVDGNGQNDLVTATIESIKPHLCVLWNGGSR